MSQLFLVAPRHGEHGHHLEKPGLPSAHRRTPCDLSLSLHCHLPGLYKYDRHANSSLHPPTALDSLPDSFLLATPAARSLSLYFFCSTPSAPFFQLFHSTMVSTRTKNKTAHPAAPVMTKAAKEKAGIKMKPTQRRVMKDQTIRKLQARIAALKNPDEGEFSKEPLVCTFDLCVCTSC